MVSTVSVPVALIDYLGRPYEVSPLLTVDPSCVLLATLDPTQHVFWEEIVTRLRSDIGPHATVWGAKHRNGVMSWELYFYKVSPDLVRRALRGLIDFDSFPDCGTFSFEVSGDSGPQQLAEIDLYYDPPEGLGPARCDTFNWTESTPKNFYVFDLAVGSNNALRYLEAGKHCPRDLRVIGFDRFDTGLRAVAHKRGCDSVYYQHLDTRDLMRFLRWATFPIAVQDYVASVAHHLDGLWWDVGVDYIRTESHCDSTVLRTSFFGCF